MMSMELCLIGQMGVQRCTVTVPACDIDIGPMADEIMERSNNLRAHGSKR